MLLLIFACGANTDSLESIVPSDHPYDPDFSSVETLDFSQVNQSLSMALSNILSFNASTPLAIYSEAMLQSEPHCPSFYEYDGNSYWFAACETEMGTAFDGYSFFNAYEQTDYFQNGTLFDIDVLNGAATIFGDAGLSHWGGSASLGEGLTEEGAEAFVSILSGTFYFEGDVSPWWQQGRSLNLVQYHVLHPLPNDQSFQQVYLNGSVPTDFPGLSAVEFIEVLSLRDHPYVSCDLEPLGQLRFRTSEGIWVDVKFDVGQDWSMTGPCDGCGTAFIDQEPIGQICPDFSGLFNWTERPW